MNRARRQNLFFGLASLALVGAGCKDPTPPAPASGMPPAAANSGNPSELVNSRTPRVGLNPDEPPVHPPTGGEGDRHQGMLPAGHPSVSPSGGPAGEMPAVTDYDPKARLAGQIDLDGKVKGSMTPGDVMFLVARVDDGSEKGGMILGVKRFEAKSFPMGFELDGRDAMAPGTKFEGKVLITARVDKDGDAMTKNPGDVLGVVHTQIPNERVRVVLDTITK